MIVRTHTHTHTFAHAHTIWQYCKLNPDQAQDSKPYNPCLNSAHLCVHHAQLCNCGGRPVCASSLCSIKCCAGVGGAQHCVVVPPAILEHRLLGDGRGGTSRPGKLFAFDLELLVCGLTGCNLIIRSRHPLATSLAHWLWRGQGPNVHSNHDGFDQQIDKAKGSEGEWSGAVG